MNLSDDNVCRLCHNAKENIIHFLRECDDNKIRIIREKLFTSNDLMNENLELIEPTKLLKFVKETGMNKCFANEN